MSAIEKEIARLSGSYHELEWVPRCGTTSLLISFAFFSNSKGLSGFTGSALTLLWQESTVSLFQRECCFYCSIRYTQNFDDSVTDLQDVRRLLIALVEHVALEVFEIFAFCRRKR